MTTQSEVVRQNDLINRIVLDRTTMEELGRIEVLWMYPAMHRVLGFICKAGLLGAKKTAFRLDQIVSIGENGILTHSQPEETDAEHVRRLESLIQHEVWTDTGSRIGKIIDCLFHLRTGTITHYLYVANEFGGITGEIYQLPPNYILSVGRRRVLVSEAAAQHFTLYKEGIKQKLSKLKEVVKEDATEELRSLSKQAQTAQEKARFRLQNLTQQAKAKLQGLNEQVKEQTYSWIEQAKEQSQVLAEQVKERSQTLSEQLEHGLETLTEQAEEIFDPSDDLSPDANDRLDELDIDEIFDFDDPPVEPKPIAQPTQASSPANHETVEPKVIDPSLKEPAPSPSNLETHNFTESKVADPLLEDDDDPWV